MLVRLCVLLRVMAFEIALMTKRGLTPVRPSSGASACSRVDLGLGNALDRLAGVQAQLLGQVQALALRLQQARQDREHGREVAARAGRGAHCGTPARADTSLW